MNKTKEPYTVHDIRNAIQSIRSGMSISESSGDEWSSKRGSKVGRNRGHFGTYGRDIRGESGRGSSRGLRRQDGNIGGGRKAPIIQVDLKEIPHIVILWANGREYVERSKEIQLVEVTEHEVEREEDSSRKEIPDERNPSGNGGNAIGEINLDQIKARKEWIRQKGKPFAGINADN
ncbi:hypothetical protein JTB14_017711 [Gonioctena quinquepunctata]|nr:hypothetical protein JTB14_017711 [Gonioctena quinquepunctata]